MWVETLHHPAQESGLHSPFPSTTTPATPSTMALSPKLYQFLVGVFASLGSLLYGYDLGVIAQVIASQSFNLGFHPTDNET